MTRPILVLGGIGVAILAAAVSATFVREQDTSAMPASILAPVRASRGAVLYCEFYNFVGRAPKVGFTFSMSEDESPVFTQTDQIEADGTRASFDRADSAPVWSFERQESPPVLASPDGAIRINLYGYDPAPRSGLWFEAGLRSVQYLNLDGQCRRSGP